MSPVESRAPRRDVRRNRERILAAAQQQFADYGLEVPLDSVAKAAGVGAGTLYRHFATRDDLVAAVIDSYGLDLTAERDQIRHAQLGPEEALERWLAALARWMRTYEGLPTPLRSAVDASETPLGATCQEVIAITDELLTRVRVAGRARPDLDGRDLFLLVLGASWAASAPAAGPRAPHLDLIRDGWAAR